MFNNQASASLFTALLADRCPSATAELENARGSVSFFKTPLGTVVAAELYSLPDISGDVDLRIGDLRLAPSTHLAPISQGKKPLCYAGISDLFCVEDILGKTAEVSMRQARTASPVLTAQGRIRWSFDVRKKA